MASASIAASTPSTKSKRKPDPRAVVAHYYRECASAKGKRGALRRTGDAFGISDESVRRYVAADEAAAKVKDTTPDELAYQPAPGELSYQAERERIAAQLAAERAPAAPQQPHKRHKPRPRCHTLRHGERLCIRVALRQSSRSKVAQMSQFEDATRHSTERAATPSAAPQTPQLAVPPVSYRTHPTPRPTRREQGRDIEPTVTLQSLIVLAAFAVFLFVVFNGAQLARAFGGG